MYLNFITLINYLDIILKANYRQLITDKTIFLFYLLFISYYDSFKKLINLFYTFFFIYLPIPILTL